MKKLILCLALLCGSAWAQGQFYQLSPAYPNATLRVCPTGTANPCPSPSSIFSDSGLTQPIIQPVQLGSTGNFGFFVAAGQYLIQIGQPYNAGFVISLGGGGGSGTVSANNGSANALTKYSAAGGSTTVGPDAALDDGSTAANTLTYTGTAGITASAGPLTTGAAGVGGSIKVFGGTSGSNTFSAAGNGTELDTTAATFHIAAAGAFGCNGASTCTISAPTNLLLTGGGGTWLISNTGGNLVANTGKGQHINTQAAANDIAGTCTAAAATTCTVTFTTAYTSAPSCTVTDQTNIISYKALPSTTTLVITTSAASSDVFSYVCIGNPN